MIGVEVGEQDRVDLFRRVTSCGKVGQLLSTMFAEERAGPRIDQDEMVARVDEEGMDVSTAASRPDCSKVRCTSSGFESISSFSKGKGSVPSSNTVISYLPSIMRKTLPTEPESSSPSETAVPILGQVCSRDFLRLPWLSSLVDGGFETVVLENTVTL